MNSKRWDLAKSAVAAVSSSSRGVIIFFLLLVGGGGVLSARWLNTSSFLSSPPNLNPKPVVYHLNCPQNLTKLPISSISPPPTLPPTPPPTNAPSACPSYFRWIHEDLRPWAGTGITRETLERSRPEAAFRLIVSNGRAYLDKYRYVFQSRDVFTLWGVLQLLNRYPGQVPDFELLFNCEDMPVVRPEWYIGRNVAPPPLFRYCKDDSTVDIVFPDWSFWGWPEINIKPWVTLIEELNEGNKKIAWEDRDPHAYWKGNPMAAHTREDLMKCNVSKDRDWNARLYAQDWDKEFKHGFNTSDLASQCIHRFKIYIEGRSWSVSEKYVLACDSPTLFITSRYHDFFNRGLMPGHHYLPIRHNDMCRSIKAAVDWGNAHQDQAQAIGRAGSRFIQEELKMDRVYDYMLHLLREYSKLLRFRPSVPEKAVELSLESMACRAEGRARAYMMESMAPSDSEPCAMPPPFGPGELEKLLERKAAMTGDGGAKASPKFFGKYHLAMYLILIFSYLP